MGRRPHRQRKHSPEFKLEAVHLMRERLAAGLTLQRVSEELDINPDLLREWTKLVAAAPDGTPPTVIFPGHGQRRRFAPAPPAPAASDQPESAEAEVRRLRRENERLRLERDFLKKGSSRNSGDARVTTGDDRRMLSAREVTDGVRRDHNVARGVGGL